MDYKQTTLEQLEDIYRQKLVKLQPLQRRFVEEYLIDLNATQAATRAGYSAKSAERTGLRLTGNDRVRECIDLAIEIRSKRTETTSEWVINELRANYEKCTQERPVLDRQGNKIGEYKYEPAAANRALELIGKHLGMFGESKDQGGKHLHLHQDKYVNAPPPAKDIVDWVRQMKAIGYETGIIDEPALDEGEIVEGEIVCVDDGGAAIPRGPWDPEPRGRPA